MKKFLIIVLIIVKVALLAFFFVKAFYIKSDSSRYGVSFSAPMARYLGLDPKKVLESSFKELGFKKVRLSAYWNEVEKSPGQYDFSDVYWQLDLAAKYNVDVVMSIGQKLPRWPECHDPSWVNSLFFEEKKKQEKILSLIEESVKKLKQYNVIKVWQVENEALFGYGHDCDKKDIDFLNKEIAVVKSLDSRPTMVTDSGETGRWIPSGLTNADMFGSTLYFKVHTKEFGYIEYPKIPALWHFKGGLLRLLTKHDTVHGMELQAEPWVTKGFLDIPLQEQLSLMNPEIMESYLNLANEIGFADYYLWGLEWWYWMKEKNNYPDMWEAIKSLSK